MFDKYIYRAVSNRSAIAAGIGFGTGGMTHDYVRTVDTGAEERC